MEKNMPHTTPSGAGATQPYLQSAREPQGTTTHAGPGESAMTHYGEKAKEGLEHYLPPSTKESMRLAVNDTRSYFTRHPYLLPALLFLSMLIGFSVGSMMSAGGMMLFSRSGYGSYSRGSPEYEAHKKLDSMIHSMRGRGTSQSYLDKLGMGGGSGFMGLGGGDSSMWGGKHHDEGILEKLGLSRGGQTRKGWFGGHEPEDQSYMARLRDMKDRMMPSSYDESDQSGFGSYLSEHLPTGLGGKQEEYHRPQKSFMDKVKGLYSKSEWEKVDEAEQKLREVLHAAAQRGEL